MKKLYILLFVLLLLPISYAATVTRSIPSTVNPNSEVTITYTGTRDSYSINEKLPTGWTWIGVTPSSDGFVRKYVSSLTYTLKAKSPSSGTSTFNQGQYCISDSAQIVCTWASFNSQSVTVSGISQCSGSSTQSCTVGSCAGTQSRTCSNGVWSSWGTCIKNDLNCGGTSSATVTRSIPSTVNPNSEVTITYTGTRDSYSINEKLPTGWTWIGVTPSSDGFVRKYVSSLTYTLKAKSPSSGTSTFNQGQYCISDSAQIVCTWASFNSQSVTVSGISQCPTCSSPSSWSACISNQKTRTNYKCDSTTNYQCQSYTEIATCSSDCTETCNSKGYKCGDQTICGKTENCGNCPTGQSCSNGVCSTTKKFNFANCVVGNEDGTVNEDLEFIDSLTNFDCFRISHIIGIGGIILTISLLK